MKSAVIFLEPLSAAHIRSHREAGMSFDPSTRLFLAGSTGDDGNAGGCGTTGVHVGAMGLAKEMNSKYKATSEGRPAVSLVLG
jgi:hypothetical protein